MYWEAAVANLTENQKWVLRKACTRGQLAQGCQTRSDHGGLAVTLLSLRRRGLLDATNQPTESGRLAFTMFANEVPHG